MTAVKNRSCRFAPENAGGEPSKNIGGSHADGGGSINGASFAFAAGGLYPAWFFILFF
jgi:hypothetical protein